MKRNQIYLSLALLAGSFSAVAVEPNPPRGDHAAAPLVLTQNQKEQFLLNAEIVKRKSLSVGVTCSQRATLSDGKLTHDAHIQTVDIYRPEFETVMGKEINFRDSYKYNIAAYRLDKLLGLNMIPVSVQRKVGGDTGAVTWWVDDVQMMEKDRYQKKIEPPDTNRWNDQIYNVRVFNQLVYNTDPNLGNLLITKDWKIWMVDFTRAFRLYKRLENPKNLVRIGRRLYNGLCGLNEDQLTQELCPYLTKSEIEGLLARRDLILKFFDQQIAKKGAAAVIYDAPGH
jgi:hypothetical protein